MFKWFFDNSKNVWCFKAFARFHSLCKVSILLYGFQFLKSFKVYSNVSKFWQKFMAFEMFQKLDEVSERLQDLKAFMRFYSLWRGPIDNSRL